MGIALHEVALDARGRLGAVADGQDDRRRFMARLAPLLGRLAPVRAQQGVGLLDFFQIQALFFEVGELA